MVEDVLCATIRKTPNGMLAFRDERDRRLHKGEGLLAPSKNPRNLALLPAEEATRKLSHPVAKACSISFKGLPPTLKDEPGTIVPEGDFVIVHGRCSGFGLPVNWIAADIVRVKDGVLVEHWHVIQDEATQEQSKSCQPTFGPTFATDAN
jgi:hypothetical protein